jgi:hypothetical protein
MAQRAAKQREEKLDYKQQRIDDGSLVIRQATPADLRRFEKARKRRRSL